MTNYFVSNSGNDGVSGLSGSPWATLAKVSSVTFSPGDVVALNRDDVWRETLTMPSSGTVGSRITLTNYGTGALPMVLGSAAASGWTAEGALYYTSQAADPTAVWFVASGGAVTWGHAVTSKGALAAEYDWWWDNPNDRLYVWSPTSPATRYASVEKAARTYGINCNNKNYLMIDGVEVRYVQSVGIVAQASATRTGLTVQNCYVSHIGIPNVDAVSGAYYGMNLCYSDTLAKDNVLTQCGRRGITCNPSTTGVVIDGWEMDGNLVYDNFHSGIDVQFQVGSSTLTGINVHHNTLRQTPGTDISYPGVWKMGLLFLEGGTGTPISDALVHHNIFEGTSDKSIYCTNANNVEVYNNTFYGSHPDMTASGAHVWIAATCGGSNRVKNNIFYSTGSQAGWSAIFVNGAAAVLAQMDYNLYWMTTTARHFYDDSAATSYTMAQWTTYKSATGYDAHSPTPATPVFVDGPGGDYRLDTGSPALDAGVTIAGVTDGYSGVAPDLGALEAAAAATTILPGTGVRAASGFAPVIAAAGVIPSKVMFSLAGRRR